MFTCITWIVRPLSAGADQEYVIVVPLAAALAPGVLTGPYGRTLLDAADGSPE